MGRKGKRPEDGQYVLLPYAIIQSPAWRSLSGAAIKVWLELHTRFNGGNNGKLFLSMNEAARNLGIGKQTAQRAFAELQEKGFLVLERPGNWYGRQAHEWRLTTKPMRRPGGKEVASNDWRNWRPEKTERGSETEPSPSRMVPSRNPGRANGSVSAPVRAKPAPRMGSETGHL